MIGLRQRHVTTDLARCRADEVLIRAPTSQIWPLNALSSNARIAVRATGTGVQ